MIPTTIILGVTIFLIRQTYLEDKQRKEKERVGRFEK
jgi:hypothetical protein